MRSTRLWDDIDDREEVRSLLNNLRATLPELERLHQAASDHWGYEDPIYRFYHQSFKVFDVQTTTQQIVVALQSLAPERNLNREFSDIIREGTGKVFSLEDNANWPAVTRPIVEAFFHARFFLEMAIRYGRELEAPPCALPSGWAALLYLYNLR